jgi:small conductance mechanosensitive channel
MMILNEIGVQIGPLVAAAGIGGLAFGFGAQTLVKDVITGFFLLIEDEIRVGDVIEIAGKEGVVERISLRTIRVRDIEGTAHIVPNSSVTILSNRTLGFSRYVMDIPLAETADVKAALGVCPSRSSASNRRQRRR